ncbi:hypothetical protein ACIBHY_36480 [Nonomuraea sp. NPDC050547]|uniref:hypothetical protein n=1 Tax=Nonomuraea sp. NPDC050547 TaxID=3364368 RepID=UPI0037A978B5
MPLPAILAVGACVLWLLWNPGVRDAAGLHGVWAQAAGAGAIAAELRRTGTALFAMAVLLALRSLWQLAVRVRAVGKHAPDRSAARAIRGQVVMAAALVAVPAGCPLSGRHLPSWRTPYAPPASHSRWQPS